jgi:hypothetical protein
MEFQLRHTTPKLILAHPSVIQKVLDARRRAELFDTRVFLIDQDPCEPMLGCDDWSDLCLSEDECASWRWKRLDAQDAKTRVASINYSSGYETFFLSVTDTNSLSARQDCPKV